MYCIEKVFDVGSLHLESYMFISRFALSNLFYHKYLDPDERKINKAIQVIKEIY